MLATSNSAHGTSSCIEMCVTHRQGDVVRCNLEQLFHVKYPFRFDYSTICRAKHICICVSYVPISLLDQAFIMIHGRIVFSRFFPGVYFRWFLSEHARDCAQWYIEIKWFFMPKASTMKGKSVKFKHFWLSKNGVRARALCNRTYTQREFSHCSDRKCAGSNNKFRFMCTIRDAYWMHAYCVNPSIYLLALNHRLLLWEYLVISKHSYKCMLSNMCMQKKTNWLVTESRALELRVWAR